MLKKNILVFPCGSEVALEIHRSLSQSNHFNLIGANSVDDHGKFVYQNYIGNLPFSTEADFLNALHKVVKEYQIDAIYPAMDSVIHLLKRYESDLGCRVIGSPTETTELCLSKSKTYEVLNGAIAVPIRYKELDDVTDFPVFLKPDIGYGSRGVLKAESKVEVEAHLSRYSNCIILEYLPGPEYTIDCFTDFNGNLLYVGARQRKRVMNGISVNTSTMPQQTRFQNMADAINDTLKLSGAWFFQVKERASGEIVLMEIAARLGGSSAAYRAKGINFAAMSAFNAFELKVEVLENRYEVELDRAFSNRYNANIEFKHVYVDFDDTLLIDGLVNTDLIAALYRFINEGCRIYLITKHTKDIFATLQAYRLNTLFDQVIHLRKEEDKSSFIKHSDAIFIDDSFAERKEVSEKLNIPVFSIDMIEMFI